MRCLQCGKRVSLLRKLTDGEFCSDEHRQLFQQQQNDLALARLIEAQQGMARPRRQATAQPARPQSKTTASASSEEKIPPFGEFLRLSVAALQWRHVHVLPLAMEFPASEAALPSREFRTLIQGMCWTSGVDLAEAEALDCRREMSGPAATWLTGRPQLALPPHNCDPEIGALTPAPDPAPADPPMADLVTVGVSALDWAVSAVRESEAVQAVAARGIARRLPAREGEETAPGPLAGLLPVRLVIARMPALWSALTSTLIPVQRPMVIPCLELAAEPAAGLRAADSVLALSMDLEALHGTAEPAAPALGTAAWPEGSRALPVAENQVRQNCLAPSTRLFVVKPGEARAAEFEVRSGTPENTRPTTTGSALRLPAASLPAQPFEFWTWLEQQTRPQSEEAEPAAFQESLLPIALPASSSVAASASVLGSASMPAAESSWQVLEAAEQPETGMPLPALEPEQKLFHAVLEQLTAPAESNLAESNLSESNPAGTESLALAEEVAAVEVDEEPAPPLVERLNPILVWRLCEPPPAEVRSLCLTKSLAWESAIEAQPGLPRLSLRPDNAENTAASSDADKTKKREQRTSLLARVRLPESWKVWQHAPADLKWVAVGLPLILALVLYSFRGSQPNEEAGVKLASSQSQSILGSQFSSLQKVIMQRAAIHLLDDFRGGLSAWDGKPGWAKSWKYGQATFLEPGQLAVYKPTLQMKDYTVEFLGQIERQGLSWVVRADADLNNYHVLRLVVTRPGPLPEAAIVRYTVTDGKEGPVTRLPMPFPIKLSTMYRVRVEVSGREITTYVQGQVVDSFTDTRLRGGGVGFFAAKGEKALLRWVEVTHQYDYLGRFCAVLAPYDVQAGAERAD